MGIGTIIVVVVFLALASVRFAEAQQAGKIPRIGFIASANPEAVPNVEPLRAGLRELGSGPFSRGAAGEGTQVGWLAARSASAIGPQLFTKELRALGNVEGKNINFEYRFADDKVDRLPSLADELLRLKPEVIVTPAFTAA
jgi:hypothetical protein